ncbi:MAG TPA: carboxypeptidase regulatory-like domain-containing protein [Terriglobales bacterium]|nr:carboxypeptidase regulatory-like domain-containing protein [Terriglobales bacterium]
MRSKRRRESHGNGTVVGADRRALRYFCFVLIGLTIVCGLSGRSHAKVAAGVSGIVTDSSGAVVSGATIQMKATETGIAETRQTNADGFFAFVNLQPGRYDLEANQTGFTTFRQTGILLDVDSSKVLNIKLKVGQVSEKVEVSGDAVQLDTASTQMGQVISERTITAVPLVTRSYTDLLALQPGVSPISSGLAGGQGGQFSATGFTFTNVSGDLNAGNLSVNGQRESSNGFLLNGTTVQEFAFSGTAIIPNLDSIAEFRIVTNNFDAEYGNYAGGQINVITKSGANRFHGSAFEFLRNTAFDGTNYFSTSGKDDHKQNQFGGTIGGPIKRDKLFFFGDYQGNRVILGQSGQTGLIHVPSAAERAGDFSALADSMTGVVQGPAWAQQLSNTLGYAVTQGEPYFFSGCTSAQCVFPGAQIPASAFTTPSQNLLAFVPPANNGDTDFSPVAAPTRLTDNKASGRVDYHSHMGMLTGYYFFDQYRQSVPNIFLPGFGSDFTGRSQVVDLGDSKTLGTSSVNELRFGFTRLRYLIHKPTGGTGVTPASLGFEEGADTLGISPSLPQYAHVPNIHFNNFSFGASGGALGVTETTFQVMDNFSRVIRTHTLTFGGQFRYNQLTEYNGGSNGDFTFNGGETGVDFADFLIGAPTNYSQGQGFPSYGRSRYIGLFAQDSWRVKPNLTLNYGLRWDVSRPWSELNGQLETLVPGLQSRRFPGSPTGWVFPGDPGIPSTLAPTRYNNFAPRIGLAYSPSAENGLLKTLTGGPGKTSIRVGWGKFYSTFEGATNFNEIGDAPFGIFYGSPVPPQFVTPFVDRGTGNIEGQRFPVPLPTTDTVINWANYLPIGTSPAFWHKNVLPYTEEYQLSVERQLGSATLLTASYVGTQGHHLLSSLEANPGDPALCLSVSNASQVLPGTQPCSQNGENGTYFPVAGGTINGTRGPFGQSFSSDGYFITIGKSSYNSLQLSVRQRISRLEFLAGYTYSKSLDNGSGYGEQINPLDQGQRSLSAFDTRHNFVVSYDYQLPFDRLGGPSRLVKGWRLSGITRFSAGLPVTLTETDDNSLLGTSSAGAISLPVDTPNFTPGSLSIRDPRSRQPYFNTSLFSVETLGTLGTARRRFFSGPGLNNWDIALLKDTLIKEGVNLEFRTELFNAFNHAQFLLPDGNVNSATFGRVQTANPPRIMQLSLKLLF